MSKVALNVVIECTPDVRDDIIRALSAHRERCLRDEPGTLQFDILIPFETPSKLFLFELYRDEVALSVHSEGISIARYREEVEGKVLNASVHTCSLVGEATDE